MTPRILTIYHVAYERLGNLSDSLKKAGCEISPFEIYNLTAKWPVLSEYSGIVLMGGPMSVYEKSKHHFMDKEIILLEEALKLNIPILGICLGAQLIAHTLGADVFPNREEEIGWHPINLEVGAQSDPMFEAFNQEETVFHLHGDTFALPIGASHLASSRLCENQAFRYAENVYGLQFHVEVSEVMVRGWLNGLNPKKKSGRLCGIIDEEVRLNTPKHIKRLKELSDNVGSVFGRMCAR
jgi:GMP synthase (glutamine-hydrolysing)